MRSRSTKTQHWYRHLSSQCQMRHWVACESSVTSLAAMASQALKSSGLACCSMSSEMSTPTTWPLRPAVPRPQQSPPCPCRSIRRGPPRLVARPPFLLNARTVGGGSGCWRRRSGRAAGTCRALGPCSVRPCPCGGAPPPSIHMSHPDAESASCSGMTTDSKLWAVAAATAVGSTCCRNSTLHKGHATLGS